MKRVLIAGTDQLFSRQLIEQQMDTDSCTKHIFEIDALRATIRHILLDLINLPEVVLFHSPSLRIKFDAYWFPPGEARDEWELRTVIWAVTDAEGDLE